MSWSSTAVVFAATLAVFMVTSLGVLKPHPTDISARRVLDGDIPYRDFWTLYAPGSIYVLAAGFAIFGRELIVSQVLAMTTAALAVACLFRLAGRVLAVWPAAAVAGLFGLALLYSRYHMSFSTYPPAITCVWMAIGLLLRFHQSARRRDLVLAGVAIGLAALLKHDVGAYASAAGAATLMLMPVPATAPAATLRTRMQWVGVLAVSVVVTMLPVAITFLVLAWEEMINNLVVYPLTDFRYARAENFPRWPVFDGPDWRYFAHGLTTWIIEHVPLGVAAVAVPVLIMRRGAFAPQQQALLIYAAAAFPFFVHAAHIQVNTHVVTLTGLSALLGASGLFGKRQRFARPGKAAMLAAGAVLAVWCTALSALPGYLSVQRWTSPHEAVALPGFRGIRTPVKEARQLRRLSRAIAEVAPPEAPIFLASHRNDVVVFNSTLTYWLSPRRVVTRHHQLHPGVTDTEVVQRRMIEDLGSGPLPVLVREYRFEDAALDRRKAQFLEHLEVGAELLDDWIERHYTPALRIRLPGKPALELMKPRE